MEDKQKCGGLPLSCLAVCPFVCLSWIAPVRLHKNTSLLRHDKEMSQYMVTGETAERGRDAAVHGGEECGGWWLGCSCLFICLFLAKNHLTKPHNAPPQSRKLLVSLLWRFLDVVRTRLNHIWEKLWLQVHLVLPRFLQQPFSCFAVCLLPRSCRHHPFL